MSNSIKVVARFRPQNRTEIELGGQPIVRFETEDTCSLDVCVLHVLRRFVLGADITCSQKKPRDPLPLTKCLI